MYEVEIVVRHWPYERPSGGQVPEQPPSATWSHRATYADNNDGWRRTAAGALVRSVVNMVDSLPPVRQGDEAVPWPSGGAT